MATSLDEYYRGLEAATHAIARAPAAAADPGAEAAVVHATAAAWLVDPMAPARACRDGCAHCCHFPVGVTFGEALRLHDSLAERGPHEHTRVLAVARASDDGRPWSELVGQACPLLEHGRCSSYEARPLPCRALASSDANACAAALQGPAEVPRDEAAFWRGIGAVAALTQRHGLGSRELRSALGALHTALGSRRAIDGSSGDRSRLDAARSAFAAARPVP